MIMKPGTRMIHKPHNQFICALICLFLILSLTPLSIHAQPAGTIPLEDQAVIREVILENYVVELDPAKLDNMTIESLAAILDENSQYLPAWAMQAFMEEFEGEFEGIGAYIIEQRGRILIAEPMPGSPAERSGLQTGDEIVSVDGTSVIGMDVGSAVNMIKGPSGSEVSIGIRRAGVTAPILHTITRQRIVVSSIRTNTFDDDIGYIRVQQFSDHTTENAQVAVDNFRASGIDKLIVDLRGNPGGLLMEGVEFSRLFIPRGPIVHVLYREGMITYSSYLGERPFDEIVILVDENTASAAEIFAGAFRDRDAGIIVGEPTYGKGSVQRVYSLPSGAGFKLTEAVYVSPDYAVIDGEGIMPSINMLRFHPDHHPDRLLPLDITRKPAIGHRGDDVAAAQQRLDLMGYTITDESGIFGQSTYDAVKAFQADEAVFPYGVLDFSTQRRLQRTYIRWLMSPEQDMQLSTALYYLRGNRSSHENAVPIPANNGN